VRGKGARKGVEIATPWLRVLSSFPLRLSAPSSLPGVVLSRATWASRTLHDREFRWRIPDTLLHAMHVCMYYTCIYCIPIHIYISRQTLQPVNRRYSEKFTD